MGGSSDSGVHRPPQGATRSQFVLGLGAAAAGNSSLMEVRIHVLQEPAD